MIDRKDDPIIDKSKAQKQIRLEKLRSELGQMGYSVVRTQWLDDMIARLIEKEKRENEA